MVWTILGLNGRIARKDCIFPVCWTGVDVVLHFPVCKLFDFKIETNCKIAASILHENTWNWMDYKYAGVFVSQIRVISSQ